ncbi:MAG TPA: methyltransferase [Terriglobales bacterium]|jgi:hypothetical protein|nr:methyltransferase [Terriglobales bacterium]
MALASGHVEARIVQTAVELNVFDALEESALSASEVAGRLKLEAKATELLLNALAALSLMDKQGELFSLRETARTYLLTSSPRYLGGMIHFESSLWNCWEKLPRAIRSGQPVRLPNMYQDDATETEVFINAMDSLVKARGDAEVLARSLDWEQTTELLDVGSGPATYPIALCKRFPKLHATIFDLPATLKITESYLDKEGMRERMTLLAGDYRYDRIPGNYDVVFLSNIIHGESAENNSTLVRKLAGQLKPHGRLIVKDHILDEWRAHPAVGALFSLLMLLTTEGGRCYSFAEIESWMKGAGLAQVRQLDLPLPLTSSLVIGMR